MNATCFILVATGVFTFAADQDELDEAVPLNFREYFQRSEQAAEKVRSNLQIEIESLEKQVEAETKATAKAEFSKKLGAAKKALAKAQQPGFRPQQEPVYAEKGSVGQIPGGNVMRIVNNDTAVIKEGEKWYFIIVDRPMTCFGLFGQCDNLFWTTVGELSDVEEQVRGAILERIDETSSVYVGVQGRGGADAV